MTFGTVVKEIKSREMISPQNYDDGGLKMIDIASFNKSLKSMWIRKYLDESNKGKWKLFYIDELVFMGNLNLKDSKKLAENLSTFLKEIFEIQPELNYQDLIETAVTKLMV